MDLRAAILQLLRDRGPDKTICPSEVARLLGGSAWRDLMEAVRDTGRALADEGAIVWTQKGARVDATAPHGPVRFARGPRFPA